MSTLLNKQVLIVGGDNSHTELIKSVLKKHGAQTKSVSCADFTLEKMITIDIDIIILDNVDHESQRANLLSKIREIRKIDKFEVLPVFVLVEDIGDGVEEVLSAGASDYFTMHENEQSILQKIESDLNQGEIANSSSAIDITPVTASITKTGVKVYVVEDDALLRNLLSTRLDKSSFPSEFSINGEDVIQPMKSFKPDVIVLDLMLPGKSGFEILAEVKEDSELRTIPVIIFSNRDSQADRQKAREFGVEHFYVKAMTDLAELIETIQSLAK